MQLCYVNCCPGTLRLEKFTVSQLYSLRLCFLSAKDAWQKSQPWSVAELGCVEVEMAALSQTAVPEGARERK